MTEEKRASEAIETINDFALSIKTLGEDNKMLRGMVKDLENEIQELKEEIIILNKELNSETQSSWTN